MTRKPAPEQPYYTHNNCPRELWPQPGSHWALRCISDSNLIFVIFYINKFWGVNSQQTENGKSTSSKGSVDWLFRTSKNDTIGYIPQLLMMLWLLKLYLTSGSSDFVAQQVEGKHAHEMEEARRQPATQPWNNHCHCLAYHNIYMCIQMELCQFFLQKITETVLFCRRYIGHP